MGSGMSYAMHFTVVVGSIKFLKFVDSDFYGVKQEGDVWIRFVFESLYRFYDDIHFLFDYGSFADV